VVDIKAFPYLCFVRFDLTSKEFDRQFNIHYDAHIQELADKPGYSTAWRTQEQRGSDNDGVMDRNTSRSIPSTIRRSSSRSRKIRRRP